MDIDSSQDMDQSCNMVSSDDFWEGKEGIKYQIMPKHFALGFVFLCFII